MAAAGFRTRRVKSEYSIGDRLKRARIRRKISVAEVEEATKIRAKFILALESDSWDQIPSEVYGKGYLEAYAQFLKMPVEQIMREYDRCRLTYGRRCQDSQVELVPQSRVHIPKFFLTPRFALLCLLSLGVLAFGGVIGKQIKGITAAPALSFRLVTPVQAQDTESTELVVDAAVTEVNITGHTALGATVSVNGETVPVADDGSFSHPVSVKPGVNGVEVVANNNGKTSRETRTVIVK